MDPKLAEMRKRAAEKYNNTPADEKPTIRLCDDCKHPIYDHKVCPVTGVLHDTGNHALVGGKVIDSSQKTMTGRELMEAFDEVRVRWQAARTQLVKIDADSIGIFQTFPMMRQWQLMRIGIMYGSVSEDGTHVTVDAIYEPEQHGSQLDWSLIEDPRQTQVDGLATALGLRRVGFCCTHQPRDHNEIVATAKELLMLAKQQSIYGDHCVMVSIGPVVKNAAAAAAGGDESSAPSNTNNEIQAEAWQASKQGVHLFQLGFFSESPDDIRFVKSSTALEVAQDTTDEKRRPRCVIKEPSHNVDTRWMLAPVAIERCQSTVIRNTFARISRPGEAPPGMANLRSYMQDPKRKRLSFVELIADFHVLIFLMENVFGPQEIEHVVKAVVTKDNAAVAIYDEMLRDHFRQLQ